MGTDLLALRRKTEVSKLLNAVPRHERYLPINAMPGWEKLPMGDKLPKYESPVPQTMAFSRAKLGYELYNLPRNHFDLKDPYALQTSFGYEALHDSALREYFRRGPVLNSLKSMGLVDEHGEVICTQKDFNAYRRYLNDLHLARVHEIRAMQEKKDKEKLYIRRAQNFAENINRANEREKKRVRILKAAKEIHQENLQRLVAKLGQSHNKCIKKSTAVTKTADSAELKQTRTRKESQVRYDLIARLHEKEKHRLRNFRQHKQTIRENSYNNSVQHWNLKVESMRQNLERNEQLLQVAETHMAEKAEVRHQKILKVPLGSKAIKKQRKNYVTYIRNKYDTNNVKKFVNILAQEMRRKIKEDEVRNQNVNPERRGLYPLVVNSETTVQRIQMIDWYKYRKPLKYEEVRRAVQTSLDINHTIYGNDYSVVNIIQIAKPIILSHLAGKTGLLPQDEFVHAFVRKQILTVVDKISKHILSIVRNELHREHMRFSVVSEGSRKSIMSTHSKDRTARVWFTESNHKHIRRPTTAIITEKAFKLRDIISGELEIDHFESDVFEINDLDRPEICHITPGQREVIVEKFKHFHHLLLKRMERIIFARINLKKLQIAPENDDGPEQSEFRTYDELIDNAVMGILTPICHNHMRFGESIISLSNGLQKTMLDTIQTMIYEEFASRKMTIKARRLYS